MAHRDSYGQFCPIAMAAEIVCTKWTPLVIRELLCGSRRFNDLRKGLGRMSPALLSQRLKDLEEAGIVAREAEAGSRTPVYALTPAGKALAPVVFSLGEWGDRWIERSAALSNLDPSLLMWDIRRNVHPEPFPPGRSTVQFLYRDLPKNARSWWLIVDGGATDLCAADPGHDVDLYFSTDVRTMTEVWMGFTSLDDAQRDGRLELTGSRHLIDRIGDWLGPSTFARTRAA